MKFTDKEIKLLRYLTNPPKRRGSRYTWWTWVLYDHAQGGSGRYSCNKEHAGNLMCHQINAKCPGLLEWASSNRVKLNLSLLLKAFLISSQRPTELSTNEYIERLEFAGMI